MSDRFEALLQSPNVPERLIAATPGAGGLTLVNGRIVRFTRPANEAEIRQLQEAKAEQERVKAEAQRARELARLDELLAKYPDHVRPEPA